MRIERVAIIGVGFMGGSFCLALKNVYPSMRTFGIDINEQAIEIGKELKVIDQGSTDISELKDFNPQLVVLASPVRTFIEIAQSLRELIDKECIVTDLGSVKGHLVYELENILGPRFVGGHPIAGTEKSGVQYSRNDLFKGKRFIITPTTFTDKDAKSLLKSLWEEIGSFVEEMDPHLHDYIFGAVSHLPHAVAFALIDALIRLSDGVDLFKYPGAGFKDFTRIAASDPIMWRDIFLENKENVVKCIDAYINSLSKLKILIQDGLEKELTLYLEEARENRNKIDRNNG